MTDRELLEAAAKAVNGGAWHPLTHDTPNGVWNPLSDDGDALRLAVELRLTVAVRYNECEVFGEDGAFLTSQPIFTASAFMRAEHATNPAAAARRAIVEAAAAIDAAAQKGEW